MGFLGENLSWIVILIILVVVILIYIIIPWDKIKKQRSTKSEVVNNPEKIKKITKVKPMHGIYNGFGGGQALRDRKLVLVTPKKDSCSLCRPFENKVLSLETYDKKYLTMSEAISKGYHHLGCSHVDEDFYPGKTEIIEPKFTSSEQEKNYQLKLKRFKFENDIRNLKYRIQNEKQTPEINVELEKKIKELKAFCKKHSLDFDEEKLNPYVNEFVKFS